MKTITTSMLLAIVASDCFGVEATSNVPPISLPPHYQRVVEKIVPNFKVDMGPLGAIMHFLESQLKNDGISVSVTFNGIDARDVKRISFDTTNASIDNLLETIADLAEIEIHLTSCGIVITPSEGKPFPNVKADTGESYRTYKKRETEPVEQDGARQPATRPESKPE